MSLSPRSRLSLGIYSAEMSADAGSGLEPLSGRTQLDHSGLDDVQDLTRVTLVEYRLTGLEASLEGTPDPDKPPKGSRVLSWDRGGGTVLGVKFTFTDTEDVLRDDFFHRFHQYFHKGGG